MKLFWRIFLSFWLATILMIGAVMVAGEFWPAGSPGDRGAKFQLDLAVSSLSAAVNSYERQGPAAFLAQFRNADAIRYSSVSLFDEHGNLLVKDGVVPPSHPKLAEEVLQTNHSELIRSAIRVQFACPVLSSTGHRYAAVLNIFEPHNRLRRLRFWYNLAIAMIPAAFVCMLLSHYLTRPITRLRQTALQLASGNLNARASQPCTQRRDELGDLARDFDGMAAQIQSLMTAQRRFVADVSHELGAPLTRLHLALALLRRQFAGKNPGELERIERETGKLSTLVRQLLLLAGMEAGACPVETLEPVSIRSLCDSIVDDANFEASHRRCAVAGVRQNVTFLAYPQLLRRAIDNVLRNAIRYSPEGSEIRLDCRLSDDGQQIILEIQDCGPGVPEPMLDDIFRPFFRTAPGRESASGGTGLGLAIASEAVHLHGGTITARNRKSGGLLVTITCPSELHTPR